MAWKVGVVGLRRRLDYHSGWVGLVQHEVRASELRPDRRAEQ